MAERGPWAASDLSSHRSLALARTLSPTQPRGPSPSALTLYGSVSPSFRKNSPSLCGGNTTGGFDPAHTSPMPPPPLLLQPAAGPGAHFDASWTFVATLQYPASILLASLSVSVRDLGCAIAFSSIAQSPRLSQARSAKGARISACTERRRSV